MINHAPKLAPLLAITNYQLLTRLPKRQRVGPSASLDEQIRKLFAFYITVKRECQFNISV